VPSGSPGESAEASVDSGQATERRRVMADETTTLADEELVTEPTWTSTPSTTADTDGDDSDDTDTTDSDSGDDADTIDAF
jgi:hypothetical protein